MNQNKEGINHTSICNTFADPSESMPGLCSAAALAGPCRLSSKLIVEVLASWSV